MKARPSVEAIVKEQSCFLEMIGRADYGCELCWACGARSPLQRAHIIPARLGGSVEPSNMFLLCDTCHGEQPDDSNVVAQVLWLYNHESQVERVSRISAPFIASVRNGEMTEARALQLLAERIK